MQNKKPAKVTTRHTAEEADKALKEERARRSGTRQKWEHTPGLKHYEAGKDHV